MNKFSTYFRASSYALVACGALTLAVSGGIGWGLFGAFAAVLLAAWMLEGTKWQFSERVGVLIVLLSLPLFYLDWQFQITSGERAEQVRAGVDALTHLILFLAAVKLLQVKADRDWLFLYLISFFEVVLAAGLSASPFFLMALCAYLFLVLFTALCFEIHRAIYRAPIKETRLLPVAANSTWWRRRRKRHEMSGTKMVGRLPLVAFGMLALIFTLALPIFFLAPRFGGGALARSGSGANNIIGFSNRVTLGEIGRLQQNDRIVMRVRVEEAAVGHDQPLRWRGVALDQFNGREWRRSRSGQEIINPNSRGLFQVSTTENMNRLMTQTFFVEPLDTPTLFAAPRAVAMQGALPEVRRDAEGGLETRSHPFELLIYRAYSDMTEPAPEVLRADRRPYSAEYERYLELPRTFDTGIASLAWLVVDEAGARNRYDAALALEAHLREQYGYSLEMKAGGPDPLSDFLFRVREGHCEYFATAMAVMLRTQGIAARVVNGFLSGEYNETADVYTVRQRNAHSWVEVYFPETNSWVTFDPTPAAGRAPVAAAGLGAALSQYAEAFEMLWIQYVVSYDRQEQRALAYSLRNRLRDFSAATAKLGREFTDELSAWRSLATGSGQSSALSYSGSGTALLAALIFLALVFYWARRIRRLGFKQSFAFRQPPARRASVIAFYERMLAALGARGWQRGENQTPLEFATAIGTPEALMITRAYNRVRFGAHPLSATEASELEQCLRRMEEGLESRV